jgi:hypothetical protein
MVSRSNNAPKTRGRPFQPGNKFGKGRPAGSRNKATLALEALIEGQGEDVVNTIIAAAKNGDLAAAKALLDRLVPTRKSAPLSASLSPISGARDLEPALLEVFNRLADGSLTPDEAAQLTGIIANHAKLHETLNLETRLSELERQIGITETHTPPAAD